LKKCCDEKGKECSQENINKMVGRFHADKDGRISKDNFIKTL
jgi:Ca2+-binding EF-hand superfamily protein